MILHPHERDLQALAQSIGTTSPRMLRHLERCSRCRTVVRDYRLMAEAAAEPLEIEAPRDVLTRALADRAAGHRSILPAADPLPRQRRPALTAAAAVLLIAAVTILFRPPPAGAGASGLMFSPAKPTAGATIEVTYHPTAALVGSDTLWLRARLRTESDEQYHRRTHQIVLTELARQRDGTFRGQFTLPSSVVYAAFAVESEEGEEVDSNHRRLWDLLVHGVEGRPLPSALVQQSNDMMGRDWVRAYAAADSVSRLEPDKPAHWPLLLFFQQQVLRGNALEAALPAHRARLARFDRAYDSLDPVPAQDLATLMWYARSLKDTVLTRKWRDRLLREAPLSTDALQEHIVPLMRKHYDQPDTLLFILEQLWRDTRGQAETGSGFSHLYQQGLGTALRTADTAAIAKWSARYLAWMPRDTVWVATQLGKHPHFRRQAIAMLQSQAAQSGIDDRLRDLHLTRSEHRRLGGRDRQALASTLADVLLTNGDTAAALANYELAAGLYWDPGVFRDFANLALVRGDSTRARYLFANVAVDPGTPAAFSDSARTRLHADDSTWLRMRADAAARMQKSVMESATRVLLPREMRLNDVNGGRTTLAALTAGRPAVIVFWSRYCGFALQAAPRIQAMAEQLRQTGIPVIIVADEKPSSDLAAAMQTAGLRAPLYADGSREVAAGFNVFGTPSYFVLDGGGNVRFEYSSLADIPRQVAALQIGMLKK